MKKFSSCNAYNSIQLLVLTESVVVTYFPPEFRDSKIMIFLTDVTGNQFNKIVISAKVPINYSLKGISNGEYQFNLYINKKNSNLYWPYYRDNEIIICLSSGKSSLKIPCTCQTNKEVYQKIRKDSLFLTSCLHSTSQIQSNNEIIINLAKSIIHDCNIPFEKVIRIHDWVANNISYDYDSLKNDRYIYEDNSAVGTLLKRRGVCQGYSNLMNALLRSSNIPAVGMLCFALGISTSGGWSKMENLSAPANHIFPIVYIGGRWLLIDVTWDSDNSINNNLKDVKTGWGASHKYYDASLEFISNTHRLIETVF